MCTEDCGGGCLVNKYVVKKSGTSDTLPHSAFWCSVPARASDCFGRRVLGRTGPASFTYASPAGSFDMPVDHLSPISALSPYTTGRAIYFA